MELLARWPRLFRLLSWLALAGLAVLPVLSLWLDPVWTWRGYAVVLFLALLLVGQGGASGGPGRPRQRA